MESSGGSCERDRFGAAMTLNKWSVRSVTKMSWRGMLRTAQAPHISVCSFFRCGLRSIFGLLIRPSLIGSDYRSKYGQIDLKPIVI